MKISEIVTIWLVTLIFGYLGASFVTWNLNPAEWEDRLAVLVIWFVFSWCVTGYYFECVKSREKAR